MENILEILKEIQHDIAEQKGKIANMESNITSSINNNIDEKFNFVESKMLELEEKINDQQKTIELIEKQVKKKNVIFFGIKESEQNHEDLITVIMDITQNVMGISWQKNEIEDIRRIGKKSDKIRPIVLTLTTVRRKFEILKRNKTLERLSSYVKEDYPLSVVQRRKDLQDELKKERELGKKVALRYDKIITLNDNHQKPKYKSNTDGKRQQKRNLSESPNDTGNNGGTSNEEGKINQIPKKNKTYNISSYMQRPAITNNKASPELAAKSKETSHDIQCDSN